MLKILGAYKSLVYYFLYSVWLKCFLLTFKTIRKRFLELTLVLENCQWLEDSQKYTLRWGQGFGEHLVNLCLVPDLLYDLLKALCEHVPWHGSLSTGASPKWNSWESYCLHLTQPFCWHQATGPSSDPLPSGSPLQHALDLLGTRHFGARLAGEPKKERKLRGWRQPPQRASLERLAWEGTCQGQTSERKKPSSQGKILLISSKLCPALTLSQASLPQMRAREQLQCPGGSTPDL